MKKVTFSFLLVLVLVVFSVAYADQPVVIIDPEASDIPASVVQDIVQNNLDAGTIRITGWHQEQSLSAPPVVPCGRGWNYIDKKVTVTEKDVALERHLVMSVAKGANTTLSTEFSKTLSSSVKLVVGKAVAPTSGELGISGSVTAKISVKKTFNGPPENSPHNSRSFYIQFYGNKGEWSATAVWEFNQANRPKVSGTWTKPTSWAEFSLDRTIK